MCLYAFVSFFTSISWPPWSTRCPGTSRFINKTSHGSTGVLARHGLEFCRHGWQKMSREFQRINGALAIKCGITSGITMDNGFWKFAGLSRSEVIHVLSIFWLCCSRHVQLCLHDISWLGQIEWDKIWDQTSPCEWMHECSLIRRLMPTSGYPITCSWHLLIVRTINPDMAFIFHAFQWAAEMGLQAEVHVLPHCQVWRRGPTLDSGCSIQRGWHSLEEGTSSCVSYVSWMHLDALVDPVKITS